MIFKRLVVDVPAKINLFLIYCGIRPDSFAEIISAAQTIDLFDRLIFEPYSSGFIFSCDDDRIPVEDNLVYRAARLFERRFGFPYGVKLTLIKRIPIEAGLGGGSADAAFTLKGLAKFFNFNKIPLETLREVGAEIGSDVPFFFTNGQAIIRGRGEIVEPANFPTDYSLCIVKPPFGINTSWAYSMIKKSLTPNKQSINLNRLSGDTFFDELLLLPNDFEPIVFENYPQYSDIKSFLKDKGASVVRLTGSGSCIYGLFRAERMAISAVEEIKKKGYEAYLAHPVLFDGWFIEGKEG